MQKKAPPQAARWIVVSTHAHRESFAAENLDRQGFISYCPMMRKRIRHARRAYDAARPLFPGYLFVRYEAEPGSWRSLLGTYGVRSVVCHGETPALLPEGFVESLKAREVDGVISRPEKPLEAGQEVAVTGGPFDGLIGRIVDIRENDRVLLLLDLLNQQSKVYVDAKMLRET